MIRISSGKFKFLVVLIVMIGPIWGLLKFASIIGVVFGGLSVNLTYEISIETDGSGVYKMVEDANLDDMLKAHNIANDEPMTLKELEASMKDELTNASYAKYATVDIIEVGKDHIARNIVEIPFANTSELEKILNGDFSFIPEFAEVNATGWVNDSKHFEKTENYLKFSSVNEEFAFMGKLVAGQTKMVETFKLNSALGLEDVEGGTVNGNEFYHTVTLKETSKGKGNFSVKVPLIKSGF